jgi:hypothetical protein
MPVSNEMRTKIQILLSTALLISVPPLGAAEESWADKHFFRIIRVTPDGEGDGRSWAHATSLQRLVDGAVDEGGEAVPDGVLGSEPHD